MWECLKTLPPPVDSSHEARGAARASVNALALYNSFGTAGWLDSIDIAAGGDVTVVFGGIRDRGVMDRLVQGQDICFHLADLIAI